MRSIFVSLLLFTDEVRKEFSSLLRIRADITRNKAIKLLYAKESERSSREVRQGREVRGKGGGKKICHSVGSDVGLITSYKDNSWSRFF